MQTNDLNKEKLRRLAQLRPDNGACVLSLFLNLDPSEFATPPARETEIRSLLCSALEWRDRITPDTLVPRVTWRRPAQRLAAT